MESQPIIKPAQTVFKVTHDGAVLEVINPAKVIGFVDEGCVIMIVDPE